jgi:hypothetical protein
VPGKHFGHPLVRLDAIERLRESRPAVCEVLVLSSSSSVGTCPRGFTRAGSSRAESASLVDAPLTMWFNSQRRNAHSMAAQPEPCDPKSISMVQPFRSAAHAIHLDTAPRRAAHEPAGRMHESRVWP